MVCVPDQPVPDQPVPDQPSAVLKLVADAGEKGPEDFVGDAVDLLEVDGNDHGDRALEDPGLVRRRADHGRGMASPLHPAVGDGMEAARNPPELADHK